MPYFTAADIPEPSCERSLNDLGWEEELGKMRAVHG